MKYIFPILVLFLLNSCASLRPDEFLENQIKITEDNIHLLNGTYSNRKLSDSLTYSNSLYNHFYFRGFNVGPDSLRSVSFKMLSEKKIELKLLVKDSIVNSKVIRGKIKNGYFVLNRKFRPIPVFYLNILSSKKCRLGLFENGNLTTDYKEISWGTGFVIIPFFSKEELFDSEFKKLN